METGINEGPAKIKPLGVGVEDVGGTAFFQHVRHALKGCQQEAIKFLILDGVVLDRQAAGALEGDAVGRVRYNQIGAFAVHQLLDVLGFGGIAAEQAVFAHGPDVAGFHEGSLLQRGREVEVIILSLFGTVREQVGQLVSVKTGQRQVKRLLLQGFDLDAQHFLVPARILGIAVVRKNVGLALRLGQVVHQHAGHLGEAFLPRSHQATVTGDHVVVLVDDHGVDEAKFP